MAGNTLFTIPIPPLGAHVGGSITVTEPEPAVYLLTISSPPDNRLTTASCNALLDALDMVEFGGYKPGVVITTSAIDKFYSNGLDLEHAIANKDFIPGILYKVFHRFLTYPMPTIALLPGHAFAGGLMLAMHHDYRIMNATRGFACVNELDFGVPLKAAMSSIFRLKLPPITYRDLVLEARRYGGPAAMAAGLVDGVGGLEAALGLVRERGLAKKAATGIYGLMKAEMYRESVALLGREGHEEGEVRDRVLVEGEERRRGEGERRVAELKAKL